MTMFPHVVTILNKVSANDTVYYIPTRLVGVLYGTSRSSSPSTTGKDNKDDVTCTIPFKVRSTKPYASKGIYKRFTEIEKHSFWTLDKGDIIVKGEVYEDELSLNTINELYEEKMIISSVAVHDYGALKHWLIGGA